VVYHQPIDSPGRRLRRRGHSSSITKVNPYLPPQATGKSNSRDKYDDPSSETSHNRITAGSMVPSSRLDQANSQLRLYAAIRPRYGAGPKTAITAGLAVWALAFALATAAPVFFHLYPVRLSVTSVALEGVEMILAALVGAGIYRENAADGPRSVPARA
jgi:hypothetical protein